MPFAYLLNSGLVSWPQDESYGLLEELISDKSKGNGLVNIVALSQVTWFMINCIVKGVHSLDLALVKT